TKPMINPVITELSVIWKVLFFKYKMNDSLTKADITATATLSRNEISLSLIARNKARHTK
ncbi:MAG: hypothetical protein NTZ48_00130, partial [Candidatus Omnitrophica bacterium]|nr:hypothetical protein [Candidatus Omnitrophota bacterium]